MRFLEINGTLINMAHVVKIEHCNAPLTCGDWAINFTMSDGSIGSDYEVDYQSMMARFESIKRMVGVEL